MSRSTSRASRCAPPRSVAADFRGLADDGRLRRLHAAPAPVALPAARGRRIGFFPGSTIGNFTPLEAMDFLARRAPRGRARRRHAGGRRSEEGRSVARCRLQRRAGVTAAFNLNLLERINRELGGDFDLDRFAHDAFYDRVEGSHRDLHPQPRRPDRHGRRPRHPIRAGRAHPHRGLLQIHDRRVPRASPRARVTGRGASGPTASSISASICSRRTERDGELRVNFRF